MARIEICVDTVDREAIVGWWLVALDYVRVAEDGRDLVDPKGEGPAVWFQQVPEAKSVKNRLHLDVYSPPRRPCSVATSSSSSAAGGSTRGPTSGCSADPEGNELCLCWD